MIEKFDECVSEIIGKKIRGNHGTYNTSMKENFVLMQIDLVPLMMRQESSAINVIEHGASS